MIEMICWLALAVILCKIIHVAAAIDVHRYAGHPLRFAAFAAYWALLAAGAVAVNVGASIGGPLLLVAALLKLSDRRRAA